VCFRHLLGDLTPGTEEDDFHVRSPSRNYHNLARVCVAFIRGAESYDGKLRGGHTEGPQTVVAGQDRERSRQIEGHSHPAAPAFSPTQRGSARYDGRNVRSSVDAALTLMIRGIDLVLRPY
jgi:hypothetical protein